MRSNLVQGSHEAMSLCELTTNFEQCRAFRDPYIRLLLTRHFRSDAKGKQKERALTPKARLVKSNVNNPAERVEIAALMAREFVKCSFREFLDHYCDFEASRDDVQLGLTKLKKKWLSGKSWKQQQLKVKTNESEDSYFGRTTNGIARDLKHVEIKNKTANFQILERPHNPPSSGIPGGSSKPDAAFYCISPEKRPTGHEYIWGDIAVLAEYKLKKGDAVKVCYLRSFSGPIVDCLYRIAAK